MCFYIIYSRNLYVITGQHVNKLLYPINMTVIMWICSYEPLFCGFYLFRIFEYPVSHNNYNLTRFLHVYPPRPT